MTEHIRENLTVLYRGKQIKISFSEITDQAFLKGKVGPMEFSTENHHKENSEKSCRVNINGEPKGGSEVSEVEIGVEVKNRVEVIEGKELVIHNRGVKEVDKQSEEIKGSPSSVEQIAGDLEEHGDLLNESPKSEKSEICSSAQSSSSKLSLCLDINKKLRVKSRRGRPKLIRQNPKNPFDIGVKFKHRNKKRRGKRCSAKWKDTFAKEQCLQVVPANLEGNSVKEALEILSSAEAMGLVASSNREEVLQVIVKRLEKGEI